MSLLSLEEARARIFEALPFLGPEPVPLREAGGRFAAETVPAPRDLPGFDNSAMDGYAVRAEDVAGATATDPAVLRLLGGVPAGLSFAGKVEAGTCVRIFTGSPLPAGADAVLMQEDARRPAGENGTVEVLEAVKPRENVRFRGEDMKQGATVLRPGNRLSAGRLGLLAALGVSRVAVGRRPVVSLLATGTELKEAGEPLGPGQIYESNRVALGFLVERAGGVPRPFPLVRDSIEATRSALGKALAQGDLAVSSGGVSVGDYDFARRAFADLGGTVEFWRVAIKPGKPLVFGQAAGKVWFGLPGNPVSALVTFLLLAGPAIARLQGAREPAIPSHPGTLAEILSNGGDRRHFMRVCVDASGQVRLAGGQASHLLSSMAEANGLVDVPPGTTLPIGATVNVLRWDG